MKRLLRSECLATTSRPSSAAVLISCRSPGLSSFFGVRRTGRYRGATWQAAITHHSTKRALGTFATADEAAQAYDTHARRLGAFHGHRHRRLNFPDTTANTAASAVTAPPSVMPMCMAQPSCHPPS